MSFQWNCNPDWYHLGGEEELVPNSSLFPSLPPLTNYPVLWKVIKTDATHYKLFATSEYCQEMEIPETCTLLTCSAPGVSGVDSFLPNSANSKFYTPGMVEWKGMAAPKSDFLIQETAAAEKHIYKSFFNTECQISWFISNCLLHSKASVSLWACYTLNRTPISFRSVAEVIWTLIHLLICLKDISELLSFPFKHYRKLTVTKYNTIQNNTITQYKKYN